MNKEQIKKHEKLLSKMENDEFHDKITFIKDGIVDIDVWNKTDNKILFFLKEAYTEGNPKFDLREDIRSAAPYNNWWNAVRWIFAIKEMKKTGEIPNIPSVPNNNEWEKWNKLMREIAIVNIKKSGGKTLSNYNDLNKYINHDKKYLREQIDLINPDIVVCANNFNYYKKIYEGDEISQLGNNKAFIHKNRTVINFWHFSNRKGKEKIYDELCKIILDAKLFG